MTTRRDIELLISARDTTGQTLPQLIRNVQALSDKLGEQALAAQRGEVKLSELERTQRELAAAGQELARQQGLIDQFEKQSKALAEAEAKAEKLVAEYQALKTALAAAETATAAQERSLASLETKSTAATAAVTAQRASLAAVKEGMEAAGIATANLDRQQAEIVTSARTVGTGLSAVTGIIDGYEDHVRALTTAERDAAAVALGDKKVADAAKLRQAAEYVQFWTRALNDAAAADQRAAALTGFRRVGQDALEASRDISRFVTVGQTLPVAANDLARGLRAIVEPGREAIRTLDGVEQEITQASAVASAEKRRVSEYSDALNRLSMASAEVLRQGGLIDSFRAQGDAVDVARAKFEQAQAQVRNYASAVMSADEPNEELARSLDLAQRELEQTGRALNQEETRLGEMRRELRGAGIDTNNLAAAQDRLEATARQAAAASSQLNNTLGRNGGRPGGLFGLNPYEIQNLGFQVNDLVVSLISGQRPLTVLVQQGSQIAQIFPGAATAIFRFALAWSPVLLAVGAVVAILGELDSDIDRVNRLTVAMGVRADGGLYDPATLARISEGLQNVGVAAADAEKVVTSFVEAGIDPSRIDEFAEAARDLADVLGVEVTDAAEQLTEIMTGNYESISELDIVTNTLTASEMEHVRVMYESGQAAEARQYIFDHVRDRMDDFAAQARGPWSTAMRNLRIAWDNFLDSLASSGAFDAARQHMSRFSRGLVVLSGLMRGLPWAEAAAEAERANFDQIWAEASAAGTPDWFRQRFGTDITDADRRGGGRGRNRGNEERQSFEADYLRQQEEELTNVRDLTRAERIRLVGLRAQREAQGATRGGLTLSDQAVQQARLNAERAEGLKIDEEEARTAAQAARRGQAAQRRAEAAARRAENQREAEERRIQGIQNQLTGQLRQLSARAGRGENAPLETRLEAINTQYERIFDTIAQLRDAGVTSTVAGMTLDEVTATVEAHKEVLRQEETLAFWEDQTNALITQRRELVKGVAEEQEAGAITVADAFREAEEINTRISPQIIEAARQALAVARAIGGAAPNPELAALIDRLERLVGTEQTANPLLTPQANVGREGLQQQERELNEIISDRNSLVENYNRLVELGIVSESEARAVIAQSYERSQPAIDRQIESIRETIELLHEQGLITDVVYANWIARLAAVEQESQYVDDRIRQVNNALQQAMSSGISTAFNSAIEIIGGLIDGTKSWGDALRGVFEIGLSFAAQFLKALADILIQMLALQLIKAVLGGGTGGIGGLLFHGGGEVGGGSRWRRNIPAAAFLAAPRLHRGGGLGLRSDEYTAILQRGEEVLDEDNPRHINNVGQGGGQPPIIVQPKIINAIDAEDVISKAADTPGGQRAIVNVIRANKDAVKTILA